MDAWCTKLQNISTISIDTSFLESTKHQGLLAKFENTWEVLGIRKNIIANNLQLITRINPVNTFRL